MRPNISPGEPVNRSMPPGIIIPELAYPDLEEAVTWLCQMFGFKERLRIGDHRSQLVLGEASIVAVASPNPAIAKADSIMVRVGNVDRHHAHVKQNGGKIVSLPTDYPYGERQYTVEDIAGRNWTFSQSISDVDPKEWGGKLSLFYKEIT